MGCNSAELHEVRMFEFPSLLLRKQATIGSLSQNLLCQLQAKGKWLTILESLKKKRPTAATINQTIRCFYELKRIYIYIYIYWYRSESVRWMIWLRWTTNGGGRPTKSKRSQRRDRRWPAKPPPMTKLVSQEWSFGYLGGDDGGGGGGGDLEATPSYQPRKRCFRWSSK